MTSHPVLRGSRVVMRQFGPEDVSERYLGWLADPVVNKWSRRRDLPAPDAGVARAYLAGLAQDEVVLAIETRDHGHIGNVKYGPIDYANRRADVSILLGERKVWGKGFGAESIHVLGKYLLHEKGLNRLDAGSANPAFLKLVAKIGWKVEGVLRERVWLGGHPLDWTLVSLLRGEFVSRPEFEQA